MVVAILLLAGVAPVAVAQQARAAVPVAPQGCLTASSERPWGSFPLRTWTPNNSQPGAGTVDNPGIAEGQPFQARLISAHGRDTQNSKEMVLLEDAAGCRAAYPSSSFIDGDRTVIRTALTAHPSPADPADYALFVDPAFLNAQQVDEQQVSVHETQHFAIWYGRDTTAFSYQWQADRGVDWNAGIETLGRWMEESYASIRDLTGAPMPYADTTDKKKVNIYICGTGLPTFDDQEDCGAYATQNSVFVSAVYIADGSSTMVHEFAHAIQLFTGGYRSGEIPGLLKIFESHANWVTAELNPFFNIWYYQNLERGPDWQTNRYGAFPLLLQLSEQQNTRDYLWRAWEENLRSGSGASQEEFLQTVVRLGQADGVYPNGFASFADDLGRYGARLAANDFVQGKVFADTRSYSQESSRYVGLTPTNGIDGYTSSADRPLWQFGSHLIPLDISPGATTLSTTLTGTSSATTAAWRYALVGVAAGKAPTYSLLGSDDNRTPGTTITLPVESGRSYFLTVTATPTLQKNLGDQDVVSPAPDTFPYTLALGGARPQLPGTGTCLGPYTAPDAVNLNFNTNGQQPFDQSCANIGRPVVIDKNPADTTVTAGASATFTTAVSSQRGATLQWQTVAPGSSQWTNVSGATASTVTLRAGTPDGTRVRVVARSSATGATVVSATARLTVTATLQAVRFSTAVQSRCVSGRAVLSVTVTNTDDRPISGTITTPYGSRSATDLPAQQSITATFSTRLTSMPAGKVTVQTTAVGRQSVSRDTSYTARQCG